MDALYISLAVTLMFSGLIAWGWLGVIGFQVLRRAYKYHERSMDSEETFAIAVNKEWKALDKSPTQ